MRAREYCTQKTAGARLEADPATQSAAVPRLAFVHRPPRIWVALLPLPAATLVGER